MHHSDNYLFFILAVGSIIILAGCTGGGETPANQTGIVNITQTTNLTHATPNQTTDITKGNISKENKTAMRWPGNCTNEAECNEYCLKNNFECTVWCAVNAELCHNLSIKPGLPTGVPGSLCTVDRDCYQSLICLNFKCELPTPENLAKKPGFALPGNCSSMAGCAAYCAKAENTLDCLKFCESFPSLCSAEVRAAKSTEVPAECQGCLNCSSKGCILGCYYKCYPYMPVERQDISALKAGVTFERKYVMPVKAVWEAGPAYNRLGLEYFIDDYKDIGVNTYHIIPKYSHDRNRQLVHTTDQAIGEAADNQTIANLIRSKKAGFQTILVAHDLYDLFPDANPDKNERIDANDYTAQIEETALKWAAAAEEYKAEYFVPVNEFEYMLYENGYSATEACRITNGLYNTIIPKVRQLYHGKIYCRVGGMDAKFSCMDFSQCDIFGFTYGFGGANYKANFEAEFGVGEQLYAKYGKRYIMAEAFSLEGFAQCSALHRAGIAAYKNTAKNGAGYAFMGLIQNDPVTKRSCPIINTSLMQDYKDFFVFIS